VDEFGFKTKELEEKDLRNEPIAFHMGTPPIQIDVMNQISGLQFEDCYDQKEILEMEGIQIHCIGFQDLLKNKKASGRHRDLDDLENLE